jgi:hypothetical protein
MCVPQGQRCSQTLPCCKGAACSGITATCVTCQPDGASCDGVLNICCDGLTCDNFQGRCRHN